MSSNEEILNKYFNKGYKSTVKLFDKLKQKKYNFRRKDVQNFIDNHIIKSRVKKYNKSLMGNKFSAVLDVWQLDTYTTEKYKTNYLIAINVNSRYVWCIRRKSMESDDFINNMKLFIEEFHPKVIECDEEKSFNSYKSVNFLRRNGIIMKVFPTSIGHEPLSIINKFCRTLRINSRYEIGDPDIPKLVKIYNKSFHSSIEMEPREMQFNRNNEYRYIYDQLLIRDRKNKLSLDNPINKGDKVRYIRDEDRKTKKFQKDKMKYQLSKYYYLVENKHSNLSFDVIAEDGSIKTVPRYKLFKLTPTEEKLLNFAPTIEDENNFQILDEIVDYFPIFKKDGELNEEKTKYSVRVISRNKDGEKIKNIFKYSIRQLRLSIPTEHTTLELSTAGEN